MRAGQPPEIARALTQAIDLSLDGIAIVGSDQIVHFANPAWRKMHGVGDAELEGAPMSAFHSEAQLAHDVRPFLARLATDGLSRGRIGHVRRDGTTFETETVAARLPGGAGPPGFVAIVRELSSTAVGELASTAFLDSIIENLPNMVFVKDAEELRFVRFNRAGEELLGYTREEMLGKNDYDFFPPDEADFFTTKDREVLAGRDAIDIPEEPIHTRLRATRWLHTKKIPLRDAGGTPRYLLGVAEDITERKQFDDTLRVSEERFRLLVESISDHAICLIDRNGIVQTWNPTAERMLGHTAEQIVGKRIAILAGDDADALLDALLVRAAATGRADYEGRCHRGNGTDFWSSVVISAFREQGPPTRFAAIIRDRTEQQRGAERQRVLAEAGTALISPLDFDEIIASILRSVVPALADACILRLTAEHEHVTFTVTHTSAEPGATLRRTATVDHESPLLTVIVNSGRPALFPVVADELLVGLAPSDEDLARLRSIGIRSAMVVPLGAHGHSLGLLALAYDGAGESFDQSDLAFAENLGRRVAHDLYNARIYTDLKLAERDTQEALRSRDEFLSIASHELRTPLAALQLQLESAQRICLQRHGARDELDAQIASKLASATRQVLRLGRLVDDLLDVSRIVAGKLTLAVESTDLRAVVMDVVERFTEEARGRGCEIRTHLGEPAVGSWDLVRIEQVVTNLISNAIKYAPEHPIDVSVECEGDVAKLVVRDHGPGVPAASLDRIFGRFERAVSLRAYGGLGLGLFISRQIVEAHGGSISVANLEPGAEFVVKLPRTAEPQR